MMNNLNYNPQKLIRWNIDENNMSKVKQQQIDDLTQEEIKDIDEFYSSKDRKVSTLEEFLDELHNT